MSKYNDFELDVQNIDLSETQVKLVQSIALSDCIGVCYSINWCPDPTVNYCY